MSGYTGNYNPFGFSYPLDQQSGQTDPWSLLIAHVARNGLPGAIPVQAVNSTGPADISEAPRASAAERGIAELLGQPPSPEMQDAINKIWEKLQSQPQPDRDLGRVPNPYLSPNNRPFFDAPRYLPEQIPGDVIYPAPRAGGRT